MFELRDEHMHFLKQYMQRSFVDRAATHIRQDQPETLSDWTDLRLTRFIETGIADARRHQIQYEHEILAWLELYLRHPVLTSSDRPDSIQEILTWPSRPGMRKVEWLKALLEPATQESTP